MSDQLTLESLQVRLEEFRKNRLSKKARIPEDIWLDACILCENQKPYLVAKALGMRFDDLKKRVAALSGEASVKKQPTRKSAGFVDLGNLAGFTGGEISLELETSGGIKIRLQCSKFELAAIGEFIHGLSRSAA